MAEKKKAHEVIQPEGANPPVQNAISAPEIVKDKSVRFRNQGKPFPCDLTQWGYGKRWPTNAIYTLPLSVCMKLVSEGLDGTYA